MTRALEGELADLPGEASVEEAAAAKREVREAMARAEEVERRDSAADPRDLRNSSPDLSSASEVTPSLRAGIDIAELRSRLAVEHVELMAAQREGQTGLPDLAAATQETLRAAAARHAAVEEIEAARVAAAAEAAEAHASNASLRSKLAEAERRLAEAESAVRELSKSPPFLQQMHAERESLRLQARQESARWFEEARQRTIELAAEEVGVVAKVAAAELRLLEEVDPREPLGLWQPRHRYHHTKPRGPVSSLPIPPPSTPPYHPPVHHHTTSQYTRFRRSGFQP